MKKKMNNEFKSYNDFMKDRPKVYTPEYTSFIKDKFKIANNQYYESMDRVDKMVLKQTEKSSENIPLTYAEYTKAQRLYNLTLKELQGDRTFINSSKEQMTKMMIETSPSLAKYMNEKGDDINIKLGLNAYEDRENFIESGEYELNKAKIYINNYADALSDSVLENGSEYANLLLNVSDEDLIYFIEELLPSMSDWYGLNGSILLEETEFYARLDAAFKSLKNRKK